jgi:hypothetical protein
MIVPRYIGESVIVDKTSPVDEHSAPRFGRFIEPRGIAAVTATRTRIALVGYGSRNRDWLAPMKTKLDAIAAYRKGWNGYSALPPNPIAVSHARDFLEVLHQSDLAPVQMAASVVGGVGFTIGHQQRQAYVEFSSSGDIHSILYEFDEESDPVVRPLRAENESYRAFISDLKEFFDGRSSRGNATTTKVPG